MDQVSGNVGTAILFENDRVRVWEMVLDPGQSSELHRHTSDYLFVYVTPENHLQVHPLTGLEPPQWFDDGYVQFNVVGREGLTHRLENVGDQGHRQILVELLGASSSERALPAQSNGRTQAAEVSA